MVTSRYMRSDASVWSLERTSDCFHTWSRLFGFWSLAVRVSALHKSAVSIFLWYLKSLLKRTVLATACFSERSSEGAFKHF